MSSLSPTSAPLALAAVLDEVTHYALFLANPITAGDLDDEQANADGYGRPAAPTMTSSGDHDEESTAEIVFGPASGTWTGPWYICAMDSGTHGAGNVIAIAVDGAGDPVLTSVTSVPSGGSLVVPTGSLTFTALMGGTPP